MLADWNWRGSDEFWPELARELRSFHTPPSGLGSVSCLVSAEIGWETDLDCEAFLSSSWLFDDVVGRRGVIEDAGAAATVGAPAEVAPREDRGDDTERELVIEVADLDGPSFDATNADLSRNFLYWYFAAQTNE